MRCLERVLVIDPENEQAKRGVAWLRSQKDGQAAFLPPLLSEAEFTQLVQLLQHPQEPVVVKAVRYLGQAGGARAVEPLLNLILSTQSKALQAEARTALIAIGTPSVDPVLQRLLKESSLAVAGQLAAILARVHSMAALAACRDVMDHAKHPSTRYAMVLNLTASVHGEPALGIVRDYLFDSTWTCGPHGHRDGDRSGDQGQSDGCQSRCRLSDGYSTELPGPLLCGRPRLSPLASPASLPSCAIFSKRPAIKTRKCVSQPLMRWLVSRRRRWRRWTSWRIAQMPWCANAPIRFSMCFRPLKRNRPLRLPKPQGPLQG
jgi:hypothetical protein